MSKPLPSPSELCVQRPLYAPVELEANATTENAVYEFITSNFQIDTFCPYCAKPTVLLGGQHGLDCESYNFHLWDQTFEKKFVCSRVHGHEFFFYFRIENKVLTKTGQSPSMADIEQGHIQHYRPILEKEHYKELNRALGLASHGVGIGSFVYLRRIFERLVEEAHEKEKISEDWDEEQYSRSRMDEKILMLKGLLPEFLVEQRTLYGILSLGIHSLDEDTCLTHFPVLRTGIELILDQKLALDQQKRKMEEAKKRISEINQQVKGPNKTE